MPLMKLRLSEPSVLIDIARIPGLSGIRETGGAIEIGACTTHYQVATSALLLERCPMLAEAARIHRRSAGPQSRHAGREPGARAIRRRTIRRRCSRSTPPSSCRGRTARVRCRRRTSSRVCSRWTWRRTSSSSACGSPRCARRPTRGCVSGPLTSRLSVWPRRSTWRAPRSGALASASPAPGRPRRA